MSKEIAEVGKAKMFLTILQAALHSPGENPHDLAVQEGGRRLWFPQLVLVPMGCICRIQMPLSLKIFVQKLWEEYIVLYGYTFNVFLLIQASPIQWTRTWAELQEMVRDREAWHAAVHAVAESDMTGQLNNNISSGLWWTLSLFHL